MADPFYAPHRRATPPQPRPAETRGLALQFADLERATLEAAGWTLAG